MKSSVRRLAFGAVLAAVYAALTILLAPISYGAVQMRVSEALCFLPFFFPYTSWSLFVGCIIANLVSSAGLLDIVFGSLATLAACVCTAWIGKYLNHKKWISRILACLMPVVWNGVIVGAVLAYVAAEANFMSAFALIGAQVAAGEAAVMFVIALPIMVIFPRTEVYRMLRDSEKM